MRISRGAGPPDAGAADAAAEAETSENIAAAPARSAASTPRSARRRPVGLPEPDAAPAAPLVHATVTRRPRLSFATEKAAEAALS
ncbi:hypothetical protein GCM10023089_04540 [Quisquiliibacterium transsilvanicum]